VDPSLNITYFKINNGAASTTNETVKLNNTVQGNAGEYRASMNQDFTNAQWHSYSTAPTFNLGGDHGTKTIYFQVKSSRGVSNVVSDTIRLEAPPPQPIPGSGAGPGPIVTPTPQPYPKTEPPRPPVITLFTINNGATTTTSRFVTLRFTVRGSVTHFRVSQRGDTFPGEEWVVYHENQENYELSAGDVLKTVYFQVKDSLGQVSSVASDSITLNELPIITRFSIPPTTEQRHIILDHTAFGATHWRASESRDFSKNLQTGPYRTLITYLLSEPLEVKTVYFQVMRQLSDNTVLYSNIVQEGIIYSYWGRLDFTIAGGTAYKYAESRGQFFAVIPKDPTSNCRLAGETGSDLILIAHASRVIGSKCDFILFPGFLNDGWIFLSYTKSVDCSPPKRDYTVNQEPIGGNPTMTFRIHLWADPTLNLFGEPSFRECTFSIKQITLRGPMFGRWEDAFR
jgi:hypothetical protein